MAVVQGIKEKVHLPIYDCFAVKPGEQLGDVPEASNTNVLKFFVNVQGKTKLQTNLQSASLLPHYNTFEARAMRVVISDLPPEFSDEIIVTIVGRRKGVKGERIIVRSKKTDSLIGGTATVKTSLQRAIELAVRASESDESNVRLDGDDNEVTLTGVSAAPEDCYVTLSQEDLEDAIARIDRGKAPPRPQLRPNDGVGTIIGKFIFSTVTSLFVGEKEMIRMPTWFFPGGAGPFSEAAPFTTHGQPDPMATFRFAEPVFIDKQQNFRVEIEVPDADVLGEIKRIYGPLFIWVVLDGFMTRDVQ